MKLHELGVSDGGADLCGECKAVAASVRWVSGYGIQPADAPGREDHGPHALELIFCGWIIHADELDANDPRAGVVQADGVITFEDGDRRRLANARNQRLHDGRTGFVA